MYHLSTYQEHPRTPSKETYESYTFEEMSETESTQSLEVDLCDDNHGGRYLSGPDHGAPHGASTPIIRGRSFPAFAALPGTQTALLPAPLAVHNGFGVTIGTKALEAKDVVLADLQAMEQSIQERDKIVADLTRRLEFQSTVARNASEGGAKAVKAAEAKVEEAEGLRKAAQDELESIQQARGQADEKVKELEAYLATAKNQIHTLESQLTTTTTQCDESTELLRQSQEQVFKDARLVSELKAEVSLDKEHIKTLEAELQTEKAKVTKLHEWQQQAVTELELLNETVAVREAASVEARRAHTEMLAAKDRDHAKDIEARLAAQEAGHATVLKEKERGLEALANELEVKTAAHDALVSKLEELRLVQAGNQQLKLDLSKAQASYDSVKTEVQKLNGQLTQHKTTIARLGDDSSASSAKILELKTACNDVNVQLTAARQRTSLVDGLHRQLAAAQADNRTLQSKVADFGDIEAQLSVAQTDLAAERNLRKNADTAVTVLQKQLDALGGKHTQLSAPQADLSTESNGCQADENANVTLQTLNATLQTLNATLQSTNAVLQTDLSEAKRRANAAEQQAAAANIRVEKIKRAAAKDKRDAKAAIEAAYAHAEAGMSRGFGLF